MMRLAVAVILMLALATGASGSPAQPWPPVLGSRESYPPDVSAAVERVWSDPTLSRTVKGRAAHVPLDVYVAFLDTPDVTAAAARFRGLASYEIRALDDGRYLASDGVSARGSAQVLRRQPRRVVMLSRGEHTGPFLGTISGSALTVIDVEPERHGVTPTLVAYVYIDNPLAASLARTLVPTFGFIADRKLGEGLRVTGEVAEWAVDPSGGFCDWLVREPLPPARRALIMTALPACARRPGSPALGSVQSP
jgi:hypothetical protein